jgi:hypothetical protein
MKFQMMMDIFHYMKIDYIYIYIYIMFLKRLFSTKRVFTPLIDVPSKSGYYYQFLGPRYIIKTLTSIQEPNSLNHSSRVSVTDAILDLSKENQRILLSIYSPYDNIMINEDLPPFLL